MGQSQGTIGGHSSEAAFVLRTQWRWSFKWRRWPIWRHFDLAIFLALITAQHRRVSVHAPSWKVRTSYYPFLHYIALISVFYPTDGTARILQGFLSIWLPCDKKLHWSMRWQALCERECVWHDARGRDIHEEHSMNRQLVFFGHHIHEFCTSILNLPHLPRAKCLA